MKSVVVLSRVFCIGLCFSSLAFASGKKEDNGYTMMFQMDDFSSPSVSPQPNSPQSAQAASSRGSDLRSSTPEVQSKPLSQEQKNVLALIEGDISKDFAALVAKDDELFIWHHSAQHSRWCAKIDKITDLPLKKALLPIFKKISAQALQ